MRRIIASVLAAAATVFVLVACSEQTVVEEKSWEPQSGTQGECYEIELSNGDEYCVSKAEWNKAVVGKPWSDDDD